MTCVSIQTQIDFIKLKLNLKHIENKNKHYISSSLSLTIRSQWLQWETSSPALDTRLGSRWWPPPLWARLPQASRASGPILASCWRNLRSSGAPSAAWASSWSKTRARAAAEEGRPTTISRMQACACVRERECVCVFELVCMSTVSFHCSVLELGCCFAAWGRKNGRDGQGDDGEEVIPARGGHH